MMIDLTDDQIKSLDILAKQMHQSRDTLIRTAIDEYLDRHRQVQLEDALAYGATVRSMALSTRRSYVPNGRLVRVLTSRSDASESVLGF